MSALAAVIEDGIHAVYQPIVDVASGEVVAFEALARGPAGSPLQSPAVLFDAARREGLLSELDWACRAAAVRGALDAGLRLPASLFVNVEPSVMGVSPVRGTSAVMDRNRTDFKVFVEVTERALTHRPAQLLEAVEALRADGHGIVLDDVGADPRSLALLPLLRPDVVKLDLSLIHNHPSRMSGVVMNGVCGYAERSGAAIVAEGVETEHHLLAAESLGATLAQGYYFGRPAPLPLYAGNVRARATTLGLAPRVTARSPVELVHAQRKVRTGRKDVLLSVSRALEAQALELGEHAVVVAAFQDVRHFTPATRASYARLAQRAAFTAALGIGMPDPPASGVRGASLDLDDELLGEWDLAVLGPHYAGALVARDLRDSGPERDRRFEFVLTFERSLVVDVAAALIARVSSTAAETHLRLVA